MSYINPNRARQTGTNRTTQAERSNALWLHFSGQVIAHFSILYADPRFDYLPRTDLATSTLRDFILQVSYNATAKQHALHTPLTQNGQHLALSPQNLFAFQRFATALYQSEMTCRLC